MMKFLPRQKLLASTQTRAIESGFRSGTPGTTKVATMPKQMRVSASLEDYLEAIYHTVDFKGAARAKDIVQRLGVHNSSVTQALKSW